MGNVDASPPDIRVNKGKDYFDDEDLTTATQGNKFVGGS